MPHTVGEPFVTTHIDLAAYIMCATGEVPAVKAPARGEKMAQFLFISTQPVRDCVLAWHLPESLSVDPREFGRTRLALYRTARNVSEPAHA